jgi:lysozyme
MTRVLSPAGVHLIASFEGFRPSWYDDGTGVQTIGYGHTGALPPGFSAPLSHDAGLALLHHDAARFAAAVDAAVKVRLGLIPSRAQARFDALCSLAFNIGSGAFQGSTVLRLVNRKGAPRDWSDVGLAFLAWSHAGGHVLPGLLNRRKVEAAIFVSGKCPSV